MKKIIVTISTALMIMTLFGCDSLSTKPTPTYGIVKEDPANPEESLSTSSKMTTKPAETTISATSSTATASTTKATTTEIIETEKSIKLISMTSPVNKGSNATIKIQGNPRTEYQIAVYYSSGQSKAAGLESKISSSKGIVSWTWRVGARTKTGEYKISINGEDQTLNVYFTVK